MTRLGHKLSKFFKVLNSKIKAWVGWVLHRQCLTCRAEERRRAWVDNLLTTAGWVAIHSDNGTFDLLKRQVALYQQIIHTDAWKDYQFRLSQLRKATRDAIERGGLDKWGKRHDDEQRSVLFMLDNLLTYLPTIQEQHDQVISSMKADEARAGEPLYGADIINTLTEDF